MNMQVVLPADSLPAKLSLNPESPMSDDDYYAFCMANPDVHFERTAQGEIIIVPPAGFESDYRNTDLLRQLAAWAQEDGRGKAFGPTAEYILKTRAALSPDASWVSNKRISKLAKDQLKKFPKLCPEFVVEVLSPSDRLKRAQEKMRNWMEAGVELAWPVDGDRQTVYIYRVGQLEPEKRVGTTTLIGEGPVAGFTVDLTSIWLGL